MPKLPTPIAAFPLIVALILGTACTFPFATPVQVANAGAPVRIVITATPSVAPTETTSPTATSTTEPPTPVPPTVAQVAMAPSVTPSAEPNGCKRPPDDYARVTVNYAKLNKRTLWMLQYAKTLYKGTINFSGAAITQGSYNPGGVAASFGTHDGGGAVDISVIRNGRVLRQELPDAIRALRIAGFAAWVREVNELYAGSPIHIHAIAIGDAELSPIAKEQLTGPFGYFRGFNGLPKKDGNYVRDAHGGPILCQWMIDMGYSILSN